MYGRWSVLIELTLILSTDINEMKIDIAEKEDISQLCAHCMTFMYGRRSVALLRRLLHIWPEGLLPSPPHIVPVFDIDMLFLCSIG